MHPIDIQALQIPMLVSFVFAVSVNPISHIPVSVNPFHYIDVPNPATLAFSWIRDQVRDLYNGLDTMIEKFVAHTPLIHGGAYSAFLYGNTWTTAVLFSTVATISLVGISTVIHHKMPSAWESIGILMLINVGRTFYFSGVNWVFSSSNEATNWLEHLSNHVGGKGGGQAGDLLLIPSISNILGTIIGLGSIAFWGSIAVLITFMYAEVSPLLVFLLLVFLAISPVGERSKKALNMTISAAFVMWFAGRVTLVFFLEASKIGINNTTGGDTPFGATILIEAGLIVGIIMQPVLFILSYKAYNHVIGEVKASAKVSGKVETVTRQKQKLDVKVAEGVQVGSLLRSVGKRAYNQATKSSDADHDSAIRTGTAILAATAAKSNPATAAAVAAASHLGESSKDNPGTGGEEA